MLRERHSAVATVFRGIVRFGASARVRTDQLEVLSLDLALVVEMRGRIEAILPELDEMTGGGLITLERARMIMYRPGVPPDDRSGTGQSM